MFRVYYLVRSLDQVKVAVNTLTRAHIGNNRIHVITRDNGELTRQGIHATSPWEDTNIMITGFYGAMVGALIGLLAGWALSVIDPWGVEIGVWGVIIAVLFFGAHGAWAGGLRGISHTNDHIKPYLKEIKRGRYLIMVDADHEEQRLQVHRLLDSTLNADRQDDEKAFNPLL